MRRGRFVGDESQLHVVDDPINHGVICEESDDLHRAAALGTEPPGAAGEYQEMLRLAVRTADAGKTATRIAAIEVSPRGPSSCLLFLSCSRSQVLKILKILMPTDGFFIFYELIKSDEKNRTGSLFDTDFLASS
jgi:hypothetical protein